MITAFMFISLMFISFMFVGGVHVCRRRLKATIEEEVRSIDRSTRKRRSNDRHGSHHQWKAKTFMDASSIDSGMMFYRGLPSD